VSPQLEKETPMTRFKNHLLVALSFVLACAIGAAFGTGSAQAVVSTLVSIVNPGTSPVHTSSVDDPGRTAYQSTVTGQCSSQLPCRFNFPAAPSGHRIVVQHIAGTVGYSSIPSTIWVFVSTGAQGSFITGFLAPIPSSLLGTYFDQPVLFYVDSSSSFFVEVGVIGQNESVSGPNEVTLTGYELDCNAAPCAPIATQ